jgi:hypothetical protein
MEMPAIDGEAPVHLGIRDRDQLDPQVAGERARQGLGGQLGRDLGLRHEAREASERGVFDLPMNYSE